MKRGNRYRTAEKPQNVRILDGALSLRARLFSAFALKRGIRRLKRWSMISIIALPFLLLIGYGIKYAVEKAYGLGIENISYDSLYGFIDKSQALRILGIDRAVNMATLDALGLEAKLEANPCIEAAHIRAELPDTLHIDVDERVPIVYVEMESGADTGNRQHYFMDPKGHVFPVVEEFHRQFMGLPVWYLQPGDVEQLKPGATVKESSRRPIVELAAAANLYDLSEIPAIKEIFRPKDWKIIITLETGAEVQMQVYDIKGQMERLSMVLEHARATNRTIRSANVIPMINPVVTFAEDTPAPQPQKK